MIDKWHLRFLRLAREVSSWSKDPSTQVGCIIVVGMIGVVVFGGGIGYGLYKNKEPEIARCTSPKGLSTIQIEQADKYCQKNNSINIVYTNTSFGAIRSVWCVYESSTGTYKDMAKCEKEEKK